MTVAPKSILMCHDRGSQPPAESPVGGVAWRLSIGRHGLEVRVGRHLTTMASPALLVWLVSLGAGGAGAHWLF